MPINLKQKPFSILSPKRGLLLALMIAGFVSTSSWIIQFDDLSNPIVILPSHHALAAQDIVQDQVLGAVTAVAAASDRPMDLVKFPSDPTVFLVRSEGMYPFATSAGLSQYRLLQSRQSSGRIRVVEGSRSDYPIINFLAEDVLKETIRG